MKPVILLCLTMLLVPTALAQLPAQSTVAQPAQAQLTKERVIQQVCQAPEITSGSEFDEMRRIEKKVAAVVSQDRQHHVYVALVNSEVINAWDNNFNMTSSMICVPVAMVHFMGDAEGELAFILSHEIGHAVDDQCKTQRGRAQAAGSSASTGAFLGALVGGSKGAAAASRLPEQRTCEARADEIGFKIYTASGYNPFDAAGAFGRLEMYSGDTGTGIIAHLNALGSDHPMTPDRIKHMRTLLINYAVQNASSKQ